MGGAKRGHVMALEWLVGTPKISLSRPPQRALWEAKGCSECIVGNSYLIASCQSCPSSADDSVAPRRGPLFPDGTWIFVPLPRETVIVLSLHIWKASDAFPLCAVGLLKRKKPANLLSCYFFF